MPDSLCENSSESGRSERKMEWGLNWDWWDKIDSHLVLRPFPTYPWNTSSEVLVPVSPDGPSLLLAQLPWSRLPSIRQAGKASECGNILKSYSFWTGCENLGSAPLWELHCAQNSFRRCRGVQSVKRLTQLSSGHELKLHTEPTLKQQQQKLKQWDGSLHQTLCT